MDDSGHRGRLQIGLGVLGFLAILAFLGVAVEHLWPGHHVHHHGHGETEHHHHFFLGDHSHEPPESDPESESDPKSESEPPDGESPALLTAGSLLPQPEARIRVVVALPVEPLCADLPAVPPVRRQPFQPSIPRGPPA